MQQPLYDKFLIEAAARKLASSDWQDNDAATVFSEQTFLMFKTHIYKHRIFLQTDIIQDIHQEWLMKCIKNKTIEQFKPDYGRTLYSWLYTSMRYHFLSVCLASRARKYHWAKHEVAISQLTDARGNPLTLEILELNNLQE
jgi:DNA-directed RNA polymerase specialized sigma24 family protein